MLKIPHQLCTIPFLGRGFRPFFALGALFSAVSVLIWGGFYAGGMGLPSFMLDPVSWHAHEMIYGFAMAIIAGFLLTATANWTASAPVRQLHLLALCLLWLAGRVVMNFNLGLPPFIVILIEGSFLPALAISLSVPLLRARNKRNFIFLFLLSVLFLCDMAFFMTSSRLPLYIAVLVIITMISLIGGRVIPAFTVAALRRRGEEAHQTPQGRLDIAALVSLLLVMLALVFQGQQGIALAGAAFIAVIIHLLRLRHYHTRRILNDPMVWVLHLGYLWVILGLWFMGLAALGFVAFSLAFHALTLGAIGTMTLGMMCRVSLGHTGRELKAGWATVFGFVLMQGAALLRIFGPLVWPEQTILWITLSAILWSASFALYSLIYIPVLWRPRPDGSPA